MCQIENQFKPQSTSVSSLKDEVLMNVTSYSTHNTIPVMTLLLTSLHYFLIESNTGNKVYFICLNNNNLLIIIEDVAN